MNTPLNAFRRAYERFVSSANLLQSPLLLVLRVYFFWQLFQTGQGKLAHLDKITEYFASLGIPFPGFNAALAGATETFGGLLLVVGLASRLTAIPVAITMAVAYLTADFEAVTSFFSNPDKFVQAAPFPFLLAALVVLAFGPGRFSLDAWISRMVTRRHAPEPAGLREARRAVSKLSV
jgi:putative oxidoreductase